MIADAAMADEALVLNEEDLLEAAVREHAGLVYRIAHSVLRNAPEAEDATQETFLRALRHGKKFGQVENPKAWLARVAWRVAVERKRRQSVPVDAETVNEIASPAVGAEQALIERERNERLEVLIAALPDSLREALVLSTIEELSPREVSEALGISEAAVRSRAFRARQILKERLLARTGDRK